MKDITIAHAGCDEAVLKKLQVSANLFIGEGYSLTFKPWEGTGTDILVANPDDAFGYKTADIAHRHGVPMMLITEHKEKYQHLINDSAIVIEGNQPAGIFFRLVEKLLTQANSAAQVVAEAAGHVAGGESEPPTDSFALPELDELARTRQPVQFGVGDHYVYLFPRKGVCAADSKESFVAVRDAIREHQPLSIHDLDPSQQQNPPTLYVSTEGFFFQAFVGMKDLPDFEGSRVSLSSWPNIKSKQYAPALASLSASLVVGSCDVADIIASDNGRVANALLHAANLSGLLESDTSGTAQVAEQSESVPAMAGHGQAKKQSGIVGALSKWLGM